MSIKLNNDQGRSALEMLKKAYQEPAETGKEVKQNQNGKKVRKDIFTKAPEEPVATQAPADGEKKLNVAFQFDLFYQLSTKVEARMGKSGANRFAELSASVAETFKGSFNLKIDAVGSFFKNTDSSLNVSPETTNEFFDSVEGLADLSPEALETFLQETEDFFSELEANYQDESGVFAGIKEQMQSQAKAFFADVDAAREQAMSTDEMFAMPGQAAAIPAGDSAAEQAPATSPDQDKIQMVFKPDMLIPKDQYQDFLQKFLEYSEKFKSQLLENFFNPKSTLKDQPDLLEQSLKTEEPQSE